MLESLGSDLRFGARTLWKSRAFSAIAIITLALGVGASTAIFSVIDNILLEPFPYPAAQRLMSLEIHNTDESHPGGRLYRRRISGLFDAKSRVRQHYCNGPGGRVVYLR